MTTEPTKNPPEWAQGVIAILRTLGELFRHPIAGAPGLGTVTVGGLMIFVCVVWFLWRVVLGGGEALRDAVPAILGGLSAWQTIRVGQKVDRSRQEQSRASEPEFPDGIPGDQEWPER